tara:strand:+ start:1669 stop:2145 length:477 start_codon:yes stop_codon:yes gene_type:complete
MSLYEKIKALGVEDDVKVNFSYEDGCDVLHYTEEEVETAMSQTGFAFTLAEAITDGVLYSKGNSILEEMRDEGLLDEYERGEDDSGGFTAFVSEVIENEHWNFGWIEHSTEKYDHKRGYTELSAEFDVPLADLKDDPYPLIGWKASVQTPNGYLTVER